MTARPCECLTCGRPFAPRPLHPMVESAWCDACYAVLAPLWWLQIHGAMMPAGEPFEAMRSDEV